MKTTPYANESVTRVEGTVRTISQDGSAMFREEQEKGKLCRQGKILGTA